MKWNFNELTQGFDYQGIRDGDIEVFDKTRYQSVVRESVQNSLDARLHENLPVKVEFKFSEFDKNIHPELSKIEDRLLESLNWEKANDDDKALITNMLKAVESSTYSYLEISDYNTRGMQASTTFDSFAHSRNVSTKSSGSSAGSKGMGKAAYFALSYLRTLIVSSVFYEDMEPLFQGIARISTHPYEGKIYNYKGYFSSSFEPEKDFSTIPAIFHRSTIGSSIYVIGLWPDKDRIVTMKRELVNNFWLAILEKELVVTLEGEVIDHTNIYNLIVTLYPDVYESGHYNTSPNPRPYIESYLKINCTQKIFEKNIEYLGEVKFIIAKNKDYQGRIANFRLSKMLIWKDSSQLYKGYCGIFICSDPDGNEILKRLENATHTEWKAGNWKDPVAAKALNSYKTFLKECIDEFVEKEHAGEITIDAFDNLLNLMGSKSEGLGKDAASLDKNKPVVTKTKTEGDAKYLPKTFNWIRNRTVKTENGFEYHIEMNSKKNSNQITFEVLVGNDDASSNARVNIIKSSLGNFENNLLELNLDKGSNLIILELADRIKHSLRLKEA